MSQTRLLQRGTVAVLATVPIVIVYALHFFYAPPGVRPTGFLQHDQAYYLANAREMFDGGTFPLYSLPFSADYTSPALYFQPLFMLLGAIVRITSADPGVVYAIAGIVAAIVAFWFALVLYDDFAGTRWDAAGYVARFTFLWGGGIRRSKPARGCANARRSG